MSGTSKPIIPFCQILYRRIIKGHPNYVAKDGSVNSYSFMPRPEDIDGLSVDWKAKVSDIKNSLVDGENYQLLEFPSCFPMNTQDKQGNYFLCVHDPLPKNNAHSLIAGDMEFLKATNSAGRQARRFLASGARLLSDSEISQLSI